MNGRVIVWETWALAADADREFRRIALTIAIPFLLLAILVPFIHLKALEQPDRTYQAPPQVVELLPEAKQPPPPPKVEPKPQPTPREEAPKTEPPKPVEKPKPLPPAPKPQPSAEDRTREARKIAENSGISAIRDSLADLRDQSLNVTPANDNAARVIASKGAAGGPPTFASSAGLGSNGIGSAGGAGVSSTQGAAGLGSRQTSKVQANAGGAHPRAPLPGSGPGGRTREEVQQTFDRSKGAFFALFNRTARDDASVGAGRVVVSFTIASDGSVTGCHVVSSSFNNPDLENKIVQRVMLLNFGAKDGPPFTYSDFPIIYSP